MPFVVMISHILTSIYHNCFINGLLANQITALIISPSISLTHVLWTQTFPTTTTSLPSVFFPFAISHIYTLEELNKSCYQHFKATNIASFHWKSF